MYVYVQRNVTDSDGWGIDFALLSLTVVAFSLVMLHQDMVIHSFHLVRFNMLRTTHGQFNELT